MSEELNTNPMETGEQPAAEAAATPAAGEAADAGTGAAAQEPAAQEPAKEGAADEAKPEDAADGEGKTYTQAEVDALLEKAKAGPQAAATGETEPAEDNELAKKEAEIKRLQDEITAGKLKDAALDKLTQANLPSGLAKVLDYSSEEAMAKSYETVAGVFQEQLAAAVKDRLRGNTPVGLGAGNNNQAAIAAEIRKSIRGE